MVLCSLIHRKQTLNQEDEVVAALRIARSVWMRKADGSAEAEKAVKAVSIVLARAGGPRFDTALLADRHGPMASQGDDFLGGFVGDQATFEQTFLVEAFMSDENEKGMEASAPVTPNNDDLSMGTLYSEQTGEPFDHEEPTLNEWMFMSDQGQYQE
ncbi:hypothetical protein SGCOL_000294 [Colletotrichum sp. CLE4]